MEKKLYNQPEIFISSMVPTTIICASITEGAGGTAGAGGGGGGGGQTIGD